MMTCHRCGQDVPRLTRDQVHCIRCALEVAQIVTTDAKRRVPRFRAKDLTGWGPAL